MIEVSEEMKSNLKQQRLRQLEARYFELVMDKAGLEANRDLDGIKIIEQRMEHVVKAYEAVKEL